MTENTESKNYCEELTEDYFGAKIIDRCLQKKRTQRGKDWILNAVKESGQEFEFDSLEQVASG